MTARSLKHGKPHRGWRLVGRYARWLGVLAGGVLLQAAPAGCDSQLSDLINTFVQDAIKGAGTGVTNLTEALVLNLFA